MPATIESPSSAPAPRDLQSLLSDMRTVHEQASSGMGTPEEHRQRLADIVESMRAERERVHEYTVRDSRRLQAEVDKMMDDMQKHDWVNLGAYRSLAELRDALYVRVTDRGPVIETVDNAVNYAQAGAVLSTGANILSSTFLGPIGGPIVGTLGGAGVLWLPSKLGELGEHIGIPRRLTAFATRAGILGGAIWLAPGIALPAAAIAGTVGGAFYLLNRFSKK